jgi:F0F1-type ATP synthase membrane subunit a
MSLFFSTAFANTAAPAAETIGPVIPAIRGHGIAGFEIFGNEIITTVFTTWIFMAALFAVVALFYRAATTDRSPKLKAVGIDLVNRLDVFFLELLGDSKAARRYLWLVAGFFVFIFFANLFGLMVDVINLSFPIAEHYLRPINSDLNTTLVLSTTIILVAQATGVY